MNKIILLAVVVCSYACNAQPQPSATTLNNLKADIADTIEKFNGEFNVYQNGLIYSPNTVMQLAHIVDSLNLKFKRCDLTRPFVSFRQGTAYYLTVDKSKAKDVAKAIKQGISLDGIVQKFGAIAKTDTLHTIINKAVYDNEVWYEFKGLSFQDYSDKTISKKGKADYTKVSVANSWIMNDAEDDYDYGLEAFYFKAEPVSAPLPDSYGRMILYSECVIDTSTEIYTGDKKNNFGRYGIRQSEKAYKQSDIFDFLDYIEKNTKQITEKSLPSVYKEYDRYAALDSMKKAFVRNSLSATAQFKLKLSEAIKEFAKGNHDTHESFEYYVANYASKKLALEMKRRRRVVGSCSMDNSPGVHAQQIAMLSAEAVNWETFLRAHLNIMNDRFERASDGSYAWGNRQTYIKELESLNLDVTDLLLGISLRTANAADKHYYSSISRMGRAFAETSERTKLVTTLTTAIADDKLDIYNRILMFYLLDHYTYNLPKDVDRAVAYQQLLAAKNSLPNHIANKIVLKETNYKEKK